MKRVNLLFIAMLLLLWSCAGEHPDQLTQEGTYLKDRLTKAHCLMEELNRESVQLWDTVVHVMDEQLPPTMPADERANMLKVRNASLIRMFETYPTLPENVQQQVDEAEDRDKALAAQMKAQMDSIKHYEERVNRFLAEAAQIHPDSVTAWRGRFSKRDCN